MLVRLLRFLRNDRLQVLIEHVLHVLPVKALQRGLSKIPRSRNGLLHYAPDAGLFFYFGALGGGVGHAEGGTSRGLACSMIEIPIAVRHLQVNTLTGAAMLHRFPIVGLLGLLHQIYGRFLHGFPVVGVLGLG